MAPETFIRSEKRTHWNRFELAKNPLTERDSSGCLILAQAKN
jgi:hypothetical protein